MTDSLAAAGAARFLADMGRAVHFGDLPETVRQRTKHSLLDSLGCILLGVGSEQAQICRSILFERAEADGATAFGTGQRYSPEDAALANGVAAHANDFDDSNRQGQAGHPSCSVVPASLALAEHLDCSGAAMLTAMTAAYETAGRVGGYVGSAHYDAGFHSTATVGCFSSAAGASSLLGLDSHSWTMALAVAGTEAAGIRATFGTMSKCLHAGRAAASGVLAARLAMAGFTGPGDILEGRNGFAWTHTTSTDEPALRRPLGHPYFVETNEYKYHAACFGTHSAIYAAQQLQNENRFGADDLMHVVVRVPSKSLDVCNIAEPQNGTEAKFSLRFTTIAGLLGWDTTEAGFRDDAWVTRPQTVELLRRVTVGDADLPTRDGPTTVSVMLRDNSQLSATVDCRTSPLPWPSLNAEWEALSDKFRRVTSSLLNDADATEILHRVEHFEEEPSVRSFVRTTLPH